MQLARADIVEDSSEGPKRAHCAQNFTLPDSSFAGDQHEDIVMKMLILLAGAAALVSTAPVAAKPDQAKGPGHAKHSTMKHNGPKAAVKAAGKTRGIVTSGRHGRLYALDARGSCPPGLAKKNNGCSPPGQAKKQFNVGQRYNRNFGNLWSYNQIPDALRSQYSLDQTDRYYYNNGYLYQVDPRTSLVERVISTILR